MKINNFLSLFNLRPIEVTLYEALFYGGIMGVTDLAKKTGISRTSVYDLLGNLLQHGLVAESLKAGVKTFQVQTPEKLQQLLEEKEKNILTAKSTLQELEKEYKSIKKSVKPKLQMFEGQKELQQMMKDLLLYRNITVLAYWPLEKMSKLLSEDFLKDFHRERVERNITLRVIWPQSQVPNLSEHPLFQSNLKFKRTARISSSDTDFSLGYAVYGDKVRFISSSNENFGFLVESAELAEMMTGQFEVLWKNSKPLKK